MCVATSCSAGRPFLVEGVERLAGHEERDDWIALDVNPRKDSLPPSVRERLAKRWTGIGLMEHASIAAFARFALQLLAVGAPAELVERAHDAMRDETSHARLAFGLASAYAGRRIGPGRLAIERALEGFEVGQLVATLVREGCIGETVAAIEAREALDGEEDPCVRHVLRVVARDEQRHAELAWRTLAWLVAHRRIARDAARREIGAAVIEAHRRNLLGRGRRASLVRETLSTVVRPLADALLEGTSPAKRATGEMGWTKMGT